MSSSPHSIALDEKRCCGCTTCMRVCPTEAIRVKEGKAKITESRCIDCSECIKVCPYHAQYTRTSSLSELSRFKYRIALPSPVLYGQYPEEVSPDMILSALLKFGFDEVYEVALGAETVTMAIQSYMKRKDSPRPLISFLCPAVVRLIQVRFPNLIDHVVPIKSPMGVAAKDLRLSFSEKIGVKREEMGLFYITPRPAQMTSIIAPITEEKSYLDGAISISDIYGPLLSLIKENKGVKRIQKSTGKGIGWAIIGGEIRSLGFDNALAVDGLVNVIRILEQIEMGNLSRLSYIEARACTEGCLGGSLAVDNPFIANIKLRKTIKRGRRRTSLNRKEIMRKADEGYFSFAKILEARPIDLLDFDPHQAIQKFKEREKILALLPGIDCGACGAPNCRALAEDIVQEKANIKDCLFLLNEELKETLKGEKGEGYLPLKLPLRRN